MVSEAEIERLRLEADTIFTRYSRVESALEAARHESGDHWESGDLELTLETPQGESIDVRLDLDASPADAAQARYDRAAEFRRELERRESVVEQLAVLPADPLAYLVCYHLDTVGSNYPRSIAGHLDAQRSHVEDCCEQLQAAGVLERIESGTVKQRRAKAKQADEVRQHHTYYRLSRQGDHLLRFLEEREGKSNVLRHLPDGKAIVERLAGGVDAPRATAAEMDAEFEHVRHCYRALQRVGLVRTADEGATETAREQTETSGTRTYYESTPVAEQLVAEIAE